MIFAMLLFGSIGIFVKNIDLSSSEIAFLRGTIGSIVLLIISFLIKKRISFKNIRKNLLLLLLSGAAIGVNWIFLFEAYRYTTVSIATFSYYFAPIFVLVLSPFILKEKLTPIKIGSILMAMAGLFFIVYDGSGASDPSYNHILGIFYGLLAAALYASVILMNKFIKTQSDFDTTFVQLTVAALTLFPYVLMTEKMEFTSLDAKSIIFVLILGIVHTGIAYLIYFSAIRELSGHTIALFSYIDPISACFFAAIFLNENLTLLQVLGGIFILGATFISERGELKEEAAKS